MFSLCDLVSPPMPYYHTFASYFQVFEMSTISRVFGPQLWNLAASLMLTCSLMMGFISLVDEIQFMLISSRHICIRFIYTHSFACIPAQTQGEDVLAVVCDENCRDGGFCPNLLKPKLILILTVFLL